MRTPRLPNFITLSAITVFTVAAASLSFANGFKWDSPTVAYQPRAYVPGTIPSTLTESHIRTDLRKLYKIGFRGLVTYGALGKLGSIPTLARQEGFDGMIIMGIWDLKSAEEWQHALSQMQAVDGYCLGNEGLGVRYTIDELSAGMARLREATGLPVTTSEPIFKYFEEEYRHILFDETDWLFPIVHPFWEQPFEPRQAVKWIIAHCDYLSAISGQKVIIKEAGFPTAGHDTLTEDSQILFFNEMKSSSLNFAYFEAFDQPWKTETTRDALIEAHWGLFYADGSPKKIVAYLTKHWAKE